MGFVLFVFVSIHLKTKRTPPALATCCGTTSFMHCPFLAAVSGWRPCHPHSLPSLDHSPCPCTSAFHFLVIDELYAQKLKYKAISEELDHALNDMTSM